MSGRQVRLMDSAAPDSFLRDPVRPLLELMATQGSVVAGRGNAFGGVTVSNHFLLPPERPGFIVLGFDAVQSVLNSPLFSVEQGYGFSMGQTMGRVLITMDDPDHATYRRLAARAFTPRNVDAGFLPNHAYPIIDRRVAELAPRGSADLLFDFAMPYPYEVIASITGVPVDLEETMARLTADMLDMAVDPQRALAALEPMNRLLLQVIQRHRRAPAENITTALIQAEVDGVRLTDDEVSIFLRQFVPAGLDTTSRGTASLLYLLLTHPDQLQLLYEERGLLNGAVDEALRLVPPAGVAPRVALEDTEIAGVKIPAGSPLLLSFTTANVDPAHWVDPLAFDIRRQQKRNLSFGAGAHTCIGLALARGQIRYAMQRLLDELPGMRANDKEWSGTELLGWGFRGPTQLPVVWG